MALFPLKIYAHAEVKKVKFYVWVRTVEFKHVVVVWKYFALGFNLWLDSSLHIMRTKSLLQAEWGQKLCKAYNTRLLRLKVFI